jgi:hypothetical protein
MEYFSMQEENMKDPQFRWADISPMYLIIFLYFAISVALVDRPDTRITQEIAEFFRITPQQVVTIVAFLLSLFGALLWLYKPKEGSNWYLTGVVPLVVWATYVCVSIYRNPTSSLGTAVLVAFAIFMAIEYGLMRDRLHTNFAAGKQLAEENQAFRAENAALKAQLVSKDVE